MENRENFQHKHANAICKNGEEILTPFMKIFFLIRIQINAKILYNFHAIKNLLKRAV